MVHIKNKKQTYAREKKNEKLQKLYKSNILWFIGSKRLEWFSNN